MEKRRTFVITVILSFIIICLVLIMLMEYFGIIEILNNKQVVDNNESIIVDDEIKSEEDNIELESQNNDRIDLEEINYNYEKSLLIYSLNEIYALSSIYGMIPDFKDINSLNIDYITAKSVQYAASIGFLEIDDMVPLEEAKRLSYLLFGNERDLTIKDTEEKEFISLYPYFSHNGGYYVKAFGPMSEFNIHFIIDDVRFKENSNEWEFEIIEYATEHNLCAAHENCDNSITILAYENEYNTEIIDKVILKDQTIVNNGYINQEDINEIVISNKDKFKIRKATAASKTYGESILPFVITSIIEK